MITKSSTTFLFIFAFLFANCTQNQTEENLKTIVFPNLEFDMPAIQEPEIPDYSVNIVDFGAEPGGQVLNTKAFEDAVSTVSEKGGGRVVIPAGIWLTGPIILKSNLEMHTKPGALVVFSDNKDLYPIIETSFEGLDTWRCISPIYGKNIENVAFTGSGVWDGSGDAWRYVKKSKLTAKQWKELVKSGGVVNEKEDEWYPSEEFKKAHESANMNVPSNINSKEEFEEIRDFLRPVMVSIQNSKRVLLDGPTFQNSPAWCIHPLMVEDLIVRNITVRNPWYSQNGDGIDVESCKNVLVENSNFDVGDDAICIKSGKNEDGRRRGVPCENLVIRNNIVYHGHGGVTVGSEMSGGVRNMHVSNCTFMGTDVGLRFKSTRGRGGVVENIFISDVRMTDIPTIAISFNLYYGGMSVSEMLESGDVEKFSEEEPVTEETPQFKDISIRNVVVHGAQQAVVLQGLPEMNLENVNIADMLLMADKGFSVVDADGVKIENVKLVTKNETVFEFLNSKNLEINELDYQFSSPQSITVNGKKSENINFNNSGTDLVNYIKVGEEVPENVVGFYTD
ncbi:MAG: glycoside hydrolase family 28 protein [Bacteroidota bacterium]